MNEPLLQFLFDEAEARPMTVSELNGELRALVERRFSSVWVEGEVVGFMRASSGHWYFNLNDGTTQIKCVCFKGTNYRIRFQPKNGITVRVRARLSIYEQRSEYQLVVESLEPSGEGALAAAFEQIRAKLDGEGLFAAELKRPIPFLPRRVAVVTSRSGAAYHDIHSVLTRRSRSVSILLVPALVQGEGSADSIRSAIVGVNNYNRSLDARQRIDVMIVGRGGGSAEDLWAFNEEMLARAIRSSEIPIISAVGHEIDWTISDLVADLRAATPSAAAEIVAGREEDIVAGLRSAEATLRQMIEYKLLLASGQARNAAGGLQVNFAACVQNARDGYAMVASRLTPTALTAKVARATSSLQLLDQKRLNAVERILRSKNEDLNMQIAMLDALSPLKVMTRGYSITQTADGKILRDVRDAQVGDKLKIRVEHGKLEAEVLSTEVE